MRVPAHYLGWVIGTKGAVRKRLQSTYGCTIDVPHTPTGPAMLSPAGTPIWYDATLTVTAPTRSKVDAAVAGIRSVVEAAMAAAGAPAPGAGSPAIGEDGHAGDGMIGSTSYQSTRALASASASASDGGAGAAEAASATSASAASASAATSATHHDCDGAASTSSPLATSVASTDTGSPVAVTVVRDGLMFSSTMDIPTGRVGFVIGKSGSNIKELQATTGCRLRIVNKKPTPGPFTPLVIVGPTEAAVAAACGKVKEKVETTQSMVKARKRALRRGRDVELKEDSR